MQTYVLSLHLPVETCCLLKYKEEEYRRVTFRFSSSQRILNYKRNLCFRLQSGCTHDLKIPMIDPDGDDVRCRWSTPAEADSVSRLLPNARIDEVSLMENLSY